MVLFARGDKNRRPIPMRHEELLEAATIIYLDGLGGVGREGGWVGAAQHLIVRIWTADAVYLDLLNFPASFGNSIETHSPDACRSSTSHHINQVDTFLP